MRSGSLIPPAKVPDSRPPAGSTLFGPRLLGWRTGNLDKQVQTLRSSMLAQTFQDATLNRGDYIWCKLRDGSLHAGKRSCRRDLSALPAGLEPS